MKGLTTTALILLAAAPLVASGEDHPTSLSYISYLERYATVLPANAEETIEAVINMPLVAGDRVEMRRNRLIVNGFPVAIRPVDPAAEPAERESPRHNFVHESLAPGVGPTSGRDRSGVTALILAAAAGHKDVAEALRSVGEPIFGMDASRISMGRLLTYLFEVTERFGMETRTELILLQRTMVVVEGVARSLDPHINIWQVAHPVVESYIKENVGPRALLRDLAVTAKVLARFGPKLPHLAEAALIEPLIRKTLTACRRALRDAGLEASDEIVVGVAGVFGERMCEVARRIGAKVIRVETEMGTALDPGEMTAAIERARPAVVAFVHAETSTGAQSDAKTLCDIARKHDCLTIVDTVTSLGGTPVLVDEWGIDAVYSGTQKCLSCTPGLSPVSFSERAVAAIKARKSSVQSWFLDTNLVMGYWGPNAKRAYHHTAPVNALYALHESLVMLQDEGLENSWTRHTSNHMILRARLQAMGLSFVVDEKYHERGIAKALYEMLIRLAKERGLKGFTAEVLQANKKMMKRFPAQHITCHRNSCRARKSTAGRTSFHWV